MGIIRVRGYRASVNQLLLPLLLLSAPSNWVRPRSVPETLMLLMGRASGKVLPILLLILLLLLLLRWW